MGDYGRGGRLPDSSALPCALLLIAMQLFCVKRRQNKENTQKNTIKNEEKQHNYTTQQNVNRS